LQSKIVDGLWSLLKPGGTLLIVTCSIFEEEGGLLVHHFLKRHQHVIVEEAPGLVFPELALDGPGQDGFFYAKLRKAAHG
jgi:16S rRNA (cytosine967-C5)-methyltransferase